VEGGKSLKVYIHSSLTINMNTNGTLYYMKLPRLGQPYLARGIVPVLRANIDPNSFGQLEEVMYVRSPADPGSFIAFTMDVPNVRDNLGSGHSPLMLRDTELPQQVNAMAKFLLDYATRNQGKLKVIALYQEDIEIAEEAVLKQAAQVHNDSLSQTSMENPIRLELEEILVKG
jgi:hypothetical protein